MEQPPSVAFTAFADVWPSATKNGDRRCPMRHSRGKDFDFVRDHRSTDPLRASRQVPNRRNMDSFVCCD